MTGKMPCHISDGPTYDDWLEQDELTEDEDAAYERYRQEQIDDGEFEKQQQLRVPDPRIIPGSG